MAAIKGRNSHLESVREDERCFEDKALCELTAVWISCLGSEPGCSHPTATLNLLKSLLRALPLHTRPRYFSFPLFVSGVSHLENKDLRVEMSVVCLPIFTTPRKLSCPPPSASQMPERTAVTSRGSLNHQLPWPHASSLPAPALRIS